MPRVSELFLYPVKSCRGHAVSSAAFDAWGFVGDRRFMVVSADDGVFLTQRTHPRLALIETELTADGLTLAAPARGSVAIDLAEVAAARATRTVSVWKSTVQAEDCGDAAAEWLSNLLGAPLRLVRMGAGYSRPVSPKRAQPGDEVTFADGAPFLLVTEASLQDLNARIVANGGAAVPMERFRPNLVVTDCAPFAEDGWSRFRIGELSIRSTWPCGRCVVTTTDQQSGERMGKEPLKTLATFRRDADDPADVNFGLNLVHETKSGSVRVGDEVVVSGRK